MSNTMNLFLKGHLITKSPIHIVPPASGEYTLGGGKASRIAHEVVYHNGARLELPCITSSTIRGGLRRATYEVARAKLEAEGEKIQLTDYYYNAVGGVNGGEDEELTVVSKRQKIREVNPVVALFGSATPWSTGRTYVQSAYADPDKNKTGRDFHVRAEFIGSRRTDDVAANPSILDLMDDDQTAKWVRMREEKKDDKEIKKQIGALEKKEKLSSGAEKVQVNSPRREQTRPKPRLFTAGRVHFDGDIATLRRALSEPEADLVVSSFDMVDVPETKAMTAIVDDEGLWNSSEHYIFVAGGHQPFCGRMIFCGIDAEGDTIPSEEISPLWIRQNTAILVGPHLVRWSDPEDPKSLIREPAVSYAKTIVDLTEAVNDKIFGKETPKFDFEP